MGDPEVASTLVEARKIRADDWETFQRRENRYREEDSLCEILMGERVDGGIWKGE